MSKVVDGQGYHPLLLQPFIRYTGTSWTAAYILRLVRCGRVHKSSFIGTEIPLGVMNDPTANAIVFRKVANTIAHPYLNRYNGALMSWVCMICGNPQSILLSSSISPQAGYSFQGSG